MKSMLIGWGPKPTWNVSRIHSKHIWMVLDNPHMQWMGIWIQHYAITMTNTHAGSDLESQQMKSWVTALCQMNPMCIGSGPKPTWNGSYIHSKHMKGVWQPSYALDWDMDPSSCHYHHTYWPKFGKSAAVTLGYYSAFNEAKMISTSPHSKHMKGVWQSSYAVFSK